LIGGNSPSTDNLLLKKQAAGSDRTLAKSGDKEMSLSEAERVLVAALPVMAFTMGCWNR
jgi:hypothetical protein